jgi:Limiting CO2-inducible proteins B/C beta carbonyic anhydrases
VISKVVQTYPKAIPNDELVQKTVSLLQPYGFGETTLFCSSICSDELARQLETDFGKVYGDHFSLGGLSGFAFGGVTGFTAMASHIPNNGSCLIVYGPHIGIDSDGIIGRAHRRGRDITDTCCGSATAAAAFVAGVRAGRDIDSGFPTDVLDAEQSFVAKTLLPYGERLEKSSKPVVELPLVLFDAQYKLIQRIVAAKCSQVAGDGKIALLGGVQINTPSGIQDYFLPLSFEIRNNDGVLVKNLLWN